MLFSGIVLFQDDLEQMLFTRSIAPHRDRHAAGGASNMENNILCKLLDYEHVGLFKAMRGIV